MVLTSDVPDQFKHPAGKNKSGNKKAGSKNQRRADTHGHHLIYLYPLVFLLIVDTFGTFESENIFCLSGEDLGYKIVPVILLYLLVPGSF